MIDKTTSLIDLLKHLRAKGGRVKRGVLDEFLEATKQRGAAKAICESTAGIRVKSKNYYLYKISNEKENNTNPENTVQTFYYKQGFYKISGNNKYKDTTIFIFGCEVSLQAPKPEKIPDCQWLESQKRIDLLGIDKSGCLWVIEVKDPSKRINRLEGIIEAALYSMILQNCKIQLIDEALAKLPSGWKFEDELKLALGKAKSSKNQLIHGLILYGRSKKAKSSGGDMEEIKTLISRLNSGVVLVRNNIPSSLESYIQSKTV